LQGTLDLLILRTLVLGPVHGHAIAKTIEFNSDEVLQVEQGSRTRRCIGLSNGDGFGSKKAFRKTIAAPSSTG
jgi:hypothetical protein